MPTSDEIEAARAATHDLGADLAALLRSLFSTIQPVVTSLVGWVRQVHDADPQTFHDGTRWATCPFCDRGQRCTTCGGSGLVCENHRTRPWAPTCHTGHTSESDGCCDCGAGAPCTACNTNGLRPA